MNKAARILEPGQMEPPAGEIRYLFLPDRELFGRRAERFRHLAKDHPQGDYLAFMALLADAQQEVLNRFPVLALPDPRDQALCLEHAMPLLGARSRPRDPAWRWGLAMILQQMGKATLPPAASETVSFLQQMNEAELEERAETILAGDPADISPHELPFLAAALQVYWVQMASTLGEAAFGRLEQGGVCPVCGSPPMVGIVKGGGGAQQGLRYLCCSLCASQWHMVRIKCSSCESTEGIDYYTLEGSNGAVKVETCDACNSYLKLLYLEKDPDMEATADDLATLSLDILIGKEGKAAGGPNLYFHPGRAQ
jgi:FdhE protein